MTAAPVTVIHGQVITMPIQVMTMPTVSSLIRNT